MKYPYKTDIAVLILFFNRPDHLRHLFDEIRKARPSKLFLYQDGARGEQDIAKIEECRQIVDNIDWDCEVYRKYQTRNYGCDPSNYISQKWAFSITDKCIVFEDDDIPSQSFFPFCKEMLDRYENDERIVMVTGFNTDEVTPDVPYDYFFTSVFSIWGWASWRRVVDKWDGDYRFLDDEYNMKQLKAIIKERKYRHDIVKMSYDHRASGKQYYESIFWTSMLFNSGLAIMPSKNQINNTGATEDSTHYSAFKTMPRALRRIFTMKRYELEFPLKHPTYVIENVEYKHRLYKVNAWGHPWIKVLRSFEELYNNMIYGRFDVIFSSIAKRMHKIVGRHKFS